MRSSAVILLLITVAISHAQNFLYQGEQSILPNWWTVGWGGVTTELEPHAAAPGQRSCLALLVSDGAEAWSGGGLRMNPDHPAPLAFDVQEWEQLELVFKINGGVAPDGKRSGGQRVQVQCQFWTSAGQSIEPDTSQPDVSGAFTPITAFLEGEVIDEDETSWQEVSIPLTHFSPAPDQQQSVVGLSYLGFQFIEQPPTAGIYLTDIEIRKKQK